MSKTLESKREPMDFLQFSYTFSCTEISIDNQLANVALFSLDSNNGIYLVVTRQREEVSEEDSPHPKRMKSNPVSLLNLPHFINPLSIGKVASVF